MNKWEADNLRWAALTPQTRAVLRSNYRGMRQTWGLSREAARSASQWSALACTVERISIDLHLPTVVSHGA